MNNTVENVAIANALQLEAADATSVLFRFNYGTMPVFAADTLLCDLTFDLWP